MNDDIRILLKVFELFPDALIIVDKNGNIVEHNKQTQDLFGYNEQELKKASINLLIPERFHQSHNKNVAGYNKHGYTRKMAADRRLKAKCKDGTEIDVDIALSSIHKGDQTFSLAVIRDISDRLKMESKVINLEKIKDELEKFSYTVSHDLKAPLQQVKMLVHLIMIETGATKDRLAVEMVEKLNKSLQAMEKLIYGILDYARAGNNEKKELVNLQQVLNEVLQNIMIPDHFAISAPVVLPVVRGNYTRLFQIFLNLVTNAIKYNNKPQGKLMITFQEEPDLLEFRFCDNGIVIAPEEKENIFKPFQRAHSATNTESHGVGLSIVSKNIEQAGGRIWYENNPQGGSCFIFQWPKAIPVNS